MLLGSGLEGVAHATHGSYAGGFSLQVELPAQVRDVEFDHARAYLTGDAPNGVEQNRAREDLPGTLHQGSQERELLGGQVYALPVPAHDVADWVQRYIGQPGSPPRSLLRPRSASW